MMDYSQLTKNPLMSPTGGAELFPPYDLCCQICGLNDDETNCIMCNEPICFDRTCAMDVSTHKKKQYSCKRCVHKIQKKLKPIICIEAGQYDIRINVVK